MLVKLWAKLDLETLAENFLLISLHLCYVIHPYCYFSCYEDVLQVSDIVEPMTMPAWFFMPWTIQLLLTILSYSEIA